MLLSPGSSKYPMLLLAGLAVLIATAVGQQSPMASADVKVVNVLTTVRDKHGKVVDNLSPNDFLLDEDGRQQAIRFSRGTDLPLTLGLLVDTNLSQRKVLDEERSASGRFIDQVLREDTDKVFLIHFDREVELLQDLTPSKQKLNAALGSLQQPQFKKNEDDSSSSGNGNPGSGEGYPGSGRSGSGRRQRMSGGTVLYDSLYLASNELMQKQPGRKVVVVLSDGVDRGSKMTLERAIEAAQRADTVVYSILLVGQQSHDNSGGWGHAGGIGGMGGPMGRHGGGYPRSPQPQQDRPNGKKILERISKETGGRMFEASKKESVDQIYQKIQEEVRSQYSLSYTPDRPGNASEYRKIHVATTQKDLVVQVRDGYYPAKQLDAKKEKDEN
jgi:VWFA-related protein